jgi:pimeloyl-ACP methyl ester carboxylesterase
MSRAASYRLTGMPYADVNGLHVYFEQHGEGPPLVLLHGGLLTVELSFGVVLPVLAEHHHVIAVELQGHGRTADTDRPMTFEYLAADVVALLDHLGIERADVFGFSLGGLTTYEMLVRHPDRIRRAVVASADHRNERGGEIEPDRLPTEADVVAMREAYAAVAPDPSHFEAGMAKTAALVQGFGGWSDDQLRAIEVPVLVLIGDTDFILVPNAAQASELMPHGQLAVLPGTTHMDMTRSGFVAPVVDTFLRQDASAPAPAPALTATEAQR